MTTPTTKPQKPESYVVRIPRDTYLLLMQMQQEITSTDGKRPSLGEVIARLVARKPRRV